METGSRADEYTCPRISRPRCEYRSIAADDVRTLRGQMTRPKPWARSVVQRGNWGRMNEKHDEHRTLDSKLPSRATNPGERIDEELLARVSHELAAPLAAMKMWIHLLR